MFWAALCALVAAAGPVSASDAAATLRAHAVARVVDGDSVILADGRQVRLIGINAPELARACHTPDRPPGTNGGADCAPTPDEPLARAARDRLAELIGDGPVRLVTERETHDHYGRWLAHLLLADGRDAEELLLREGLASAIAMPPNVAALTRYRSAEGEARRARRGIWGDAYFQPLPAERLSAAHTGYRLVTGRINRVGRSRKYVYLDLGKKFSVMVAHADWHSHFSGRPDDLLGREVEVRGWITAYDGKRRVRIRHPAMLDLLDNH